ncbi:uncharacterized protein LOC135401157 [Ornithodoros turicata]|uniref:uncharacterized protein LOC135401157 n=1 Tax=Ornithodoros turicata TaxID=34597 RepID=UPI003139B2B5
MSDSSGDYDPIRDALIDHVKAFNGPGISYCYPRSPVYIHLPKPLKEVGSIFFQAIMPKNIRLGMWEFTKKGDMKNIWGNMTLNGYGGWFRVTSSNVKAGNTDQYEWHNSDVGRVCKVFEHGGEHFVELHLDKETGDLVTKVDGLVYNIHDMEDGADADEFTMYGDFYLPEVAIPFDDFKLPYAVDLNGGVCFADVYEITFVPDEKARDMTITFGDVKFTIDFRDHREAMGKYSREKVTINSHCNCAFISLNNKIVHEVMRRLTATQMVIEGDIKLHHVTVRKK